MNTAFFYALILALINIVLSLVGFFLGYQTDKIMQGRWFVILSVVAVIVVLWLPGRKRRINRSATARA